MSEPVFPWTDAYLLGYQAMDETHKEFVDLVNALLEATDEEFLPCLQRFSAHAQTHFDQEKLWMESSEFPPMQCHVDEHNAVLKPLPEVEKRVANGDIAIGRALAAELHRWFPGHADYMDAPLAQWLVKKSHGGKPVVLRRNVSKPEMSRPVVVGKPVKSTG